MYFYDNWYVHHWPWPSEYLGRHVLQQREILKVFRETINITTIAKQITLVCTDVCFRVGGNPSTKPVWFGDYIIISHTHAGNRTLVTVVRERYVTTPPADSQLFVKPLSVWYLGNTCTSITYKSAYDWFRILCWALFLLWKACVTTLWEVQNLFIDETT